MLAQFALVAFALLALLSLVIDLGFVRLTQAQMQNAADTAALEGLRKRDVAAVDPITGAVVDDPFASDCLRRSSAHRLVRWVFDDDLGQTAGDPGYQFGAGPVIDLSEGVSNLHALQTLSVPDPRVYEPYLQLNQQNAVEGDMVSGRFCYSADPAASEGLAYELPGAVVCDDVQRGFGPYARNDFNPSPTAPEPLGGLQACPSPEEVPSDQGGVPAAAAWAGPEDSAFLVRLRRSNELADLDGQTEPGIASSGPALPLVFGRGSTIEGDDPLSGYSVRRDGLTVRATAIAEARPALQVGLPQAAPYRPGVTPFALIDTFVQTLGADVAPATVTINPANGVICNGLACGGINAPNAVGRFVDSLTDPSRVRWKAISTVGQALPAPVAVACASANTFSGYGPVYSRMSSGAVRVIGFARIDLEPDPGRPANPCAARVSRGASIVAPSNATATLIGGLPLPGDAQPEDVRELLDKNVERNGGATYGPVLVPVLAR